MNKFYKIYSLATIGLLSLGFMTSCNEKDDYELAAPVTGTQAYFSSTETSSYQLQSDASSFNVRVYRATDSDNTTVPITVKASDSNTATDAFIFPASVSFSAGSNTTNIVVQYDIDKVPYDETQSFDIIIDDSETTPYGRGSMTITAVYASPWDELGTCLYTDYFVGTFFGVGDDTYELQISENSLTPGLFRILNPYGEAYPYNDPGDWDDSKDYYMYINATNPKQVFICDNTGAPAFFYSGLDWGYGEFVMTTFASYYLRQGDEASAAQYYGFYEDGVIYLPGSSTLCAMMDYQGGGLYSRSFNGPAQFIVMPGVVLADTSVEVTYNGMFYKADDSQEVVAYVTLGADVTEAKVAIVPGANPGSSVVNDIVSGAISSVSVSASGQVNLPFDSTNASGKYSVVAVTYYNGEVKEYAYQSFTYTAGTPESWNYIGTGVYTFLTDMWGEDDDDIVQDALELYESDATPGKFKLENWMGPEYPFVFTMNADGSITFEEQETGVNSPYGMISVVGMNEYFDETDYPSYFSDGIYYFAVVYAVSAGYFANGYETFELIEGSSSNTRSYSAPSSGIRLMNAGKKVTMFRKVGENMKGHFMFNMPVVK